MKLYLSIQRVVASATPAAQPSNMIAMLLAALKPGQSDIVPITGAFDSIQMAAIKSAWPNVSSVAAPISPTPAIWMVRGTNGDLGTTKINASSVTFGISVLTPFNTVLTPTVPRLDYAWPSTTLAPNSFKAPVEFGQSPTGRSLARSTFLGLNPYPATGTTSIAALTQSANIDGLNVSSSLVTRSKLAHPSFSLAEYHAFLQPRGGVPYRGIWHSLTMGNPDQHWTARSPFINNWASLVEMNVVSPYASASVHHFFEIDIPDAIVQSGGSPNADYYIAVPIGTQTAYWIPSVGGFFCNATYQGLGSGSYAVFPLSRFLNTTTPLTYENNGQTGNVWERFSPLGINSAYRLNERIRVGTSAINATNLLSYSGPLP